LLIHFSTCNKQFRHSSLRGLLAFRPPPASFTFLTRAQKTCFYRLRKSEVRGEKKSWVRIGILRLCNMRNYKLARNNNCSENKLASNNMIPSLDNKRSSSPVREQTGCLSMVSDSQFKPIDLNGYQLSRMTQQALPIAIIIRIFFCLRISLNLEY
jgi:hypothetical protein